MIKKIENTEKTDNWKYSSTEGIVILLDALGTKGIWKDQLPEAVLKIREVLGMTIKRKFEKIFPNKSTCNIFSDTIIITIEGKLEDNFVKMSANLFSLFVVSLGLKINLRGAINFGVIHKSKNSIIGPAIDECSQFYELPNLVGVVMCPTLSIMLEKNTSITNLDKDYSFPKYDLPLKEFRIMKDMRLMRIFGEYSLEHHLVKIIPQDIKTIKELIQYNIMNVAELEPKLKWKNTLDFINEIKLENEEELMSKGLSEILKDREKKE